MKDGAIRSPLGTTQGQVYCRCGQVVSALVAAGLIARPELSTSESEIYEWWLVSPLLAERLQAVRAPVLQFHELRMWGRTQTGLPVEEDPVLVNALRSMK